MKIRIYKINSKLDFGKYRGYTIYDILSKDPSYLQWCTRKVAFFMLSEDAFELLILALLPDRFLLDTFEIMKEKREILEDEKRLWSKWEAEATLREEDRDFWENFAEGCGDFSCDACPNTGCSAHPWN